MRNYYNEKIKTTTLFFFELEYALIIDVSAKEVAIFNITYYLI
jgi:hypothetical protein